MRHTARRGLEALIAKQIARKLTSTTKALSEAQREAHYGSALLYTLLQLRHEAPNASAARFFTELRRRCALSRRACVAATSLGEWCVWRASVASAPIPFGHFHMLGDTSNSFNSCLPATELPAGVLRRECDGIDESTHARTLEQYGVDERACGDASIEQLCHLMCRVGDVKRNTPHPPISYRTARPK